MHGKAALKAFQNDALETATPNKLLTMLFERMCLDIARAEVAQTDENWDVAHENLTHAQAIISALQEALDPAWEQASDMRDIYSYLYQLLVRANLARKVEITHECAEIAEPLRDMWNQAAVLAAQQSGTAAAAELA